MDMHHAPFDPTDVRARFNPPYPLTPIKIDAEQFIGRTILLDPRRVKLMKGQPRTDIRRIKRLATGIKGFGQNTSILVHPISDPDFDVELQAGERRTKACIEAGIMIRAEVRDVPENDKAHYVVSFVENFNREPLTTMETVLGIRRLLADGHSKSDIADMAGKTYGWVIQMATLGELHPEVLPYLDERKGDQRSQTGRKLRRTTALPLTAALQIAKLPQEEQLAFVLATAAEARSLNEVQRLVARRLVGVEGVRKRSANERFDTLQRQVASFGALLGRYLDMSMPELRGLFASHDPHDLASFAEGLREVAMHLKSLAEVASPRSTVKEVGHVGNK